MIYWFCNCILIGFFASLISKRCKIWISPPVFWTALSLKLVAGVILGWIFLEEYDGADTFFYFNQAKALTQQQQSLQQYFSELLTLSNYEQTSHPRTFFFVKILSVVLVLSGSSYWLSTILFSFISFLAFIYFVCRFSSLYPALRKHSTIVLLFIPSIIFWSSGVLKETISSPSFLILVINTILIYKKKKLSVMDIILTLFSIYVLYRLRNHLLITYLIFLGTLSFITFIKSSKKINKRLAFSTLIIAGLGSQVVHPYLNLNRLPRTLYETNQSILNKKANKNHLSINIKNPDWISVLEAIPVAIKTGLFGPTIFDKTLAIGFLHKIENLIITILCFLSIFLWIIEKPKVDSPLVLSSIISILILATMLAIATPNFGTLVRYKSAFTPFLFILSSILPSQFLVRTKAE